MELDPSIAVQNRPEARMVSSGLTSMCGLAEKYVTAKQRASMAPATGITTGRAILGVVDGCPPKAAEGREDAKKRHEFVRKIGYKL